MILRPFRYLLSQTDQPTDQQNNQQTYQPSNQQTNMMVRREVTLPISKCANDSKKGPNTRHNTTPKHVRQPDESPTDEFVSQIRKTCLILSIEYLVLKLLLDVEEL